MVFGFSQSHTPSHRPCSSTWCEVPLVVLLERYGVDQPDDASAGNVRTMLVHRLIWAFSRSSGSVPWICVQDAGEKVMNASIAGIDLRTLQR